MATKQSTTDRLKRKHAGDRNRLMQGQQKRLEQISTRPEMAEQILGIRDKAR